ncbi:LysR family transcriptional regulator [Maridesulfovibrio hydrothermalis]|uniref:Transcriptional regulator, LysR family n=1 Tax=Maridesulfovibrio hydrothermalis AM13 = DSM 14728 TaxID=1121451 RepID=L0R8K1_9BACT|nr:LysR family transcriptional regulator [Maridesulfovibrio hydrothermalis]CCO23093.1 Transcriptional regulator, LysR family [Maridesulfovibrio hydrothermalis AM13 = DSM 14728]
MLPDLNRLKVFYHIFNEQSSTGAAKLLHITQSGVSQHLKKLEDELQTKLFTRVNRRLVSTSAGLKLYDIVKSFMVELESGVRHINETTVKPSGVLRIGAPSEFGKTYLPKIFASFYRQYPDVSLQLELGDPKVLFSMVSNGELDFAYIDILPILMDTPGGVSSYSIEPVVSEEFVLACSRGYYEKYMSDAEYDDLIGLDFIAYKTDIALFSSWFKLHFDKSPSSLNLVFTADSAGAIISAIEEDMGLGITVSHLMTKQIADGSIIPIRITQNKLQNTIACVQFKDKERTVTENAFQEHLRIELDLISDLFIKS